MRPTPLCTSMLQEPLLITPAHQQMLSLTWCCAELPQWAVDCSNTPRLGGFAAPGIAAMSACTPTSMQWTAADAESLSMQSSASNSQGVHGFLTPACVMSSAAAISLIRYLRPSPGYNPNLDSCTTPLPAQPICNPDGLSYILIQPHPITPSYPPPPHIHPSF